MFTNHIYIYIYIYIYREREREREIDNKEIQVEREIYWEVDTIAFRFYWTIIRALREGILAMQYLAFLNIYRWLNIANITPHGPDDGSVEPKCYSVDFLINLSFHLDYLVIKFSQHIVGLQSIIYFYIYIYIYIYICKCLLLTNNLHFYSTNWFKIFRGYFIRIQECFYILLSKNITIIKKNIFNKSFFSEKRRTRIMKENITSIFQGLVWWILWHINLCRLFNAKSIFM